MKFEMKKKSNKSPEKDFLAKELEIKINEDKAPVTSRAAGGPCRTPRNSREGIIYAFSTELCCRTLKLAHLFLLVLLGFIINFLPCTNCKQMVLVCAVSCTAVSSTTCWRVSGIFTHG